MYHYFQNILLLFIDIINTIKNLFLARVTINKEILIKEIVFSLLSLFLIENKTMTRELRLYNEISLKHNIDIEK